MKVHHSCPHCGHGKHSAPHVHKHKCHMCGGSWFSSLVSGAKALASHPMVSQALSHAAPMAMALAQKHAPGLVSKVQSLASHPMAQRALAHPMAQAAMGAVRSRLGMGRRRKHHPHYGAMLPLGHASAGEQAYGEMHASGRHRHRHGGKGGPMGFASKLLGAIPGAANALGPFGEMLGMEAPPPPPHATFGAVRAGPQMNARPHGVGRGMGHHKVHHSCPHCGHGKHSAHHVSKHKCRACGGSWFSSLVSGAKALASHPMVSQALSHAAPMAMALAQKHAPGLVSKVQSLAAHPMAQRALAHPMAQAAMGAVRSRLGMGRRSRGPTAHSLAVGHVMKQTGMGLGQASRYVKENGLAY